jgi:hypothetical protein
MRSFKSSNLGQVYKVYDATGKINILNDYSIVLG